MGMREEELIIIQRVVVGRGKRATKKCSYCTVVDALAKVHATVVRVAGARAISGYTSLGASDDHERRVGLRLLRPLSLPAL